MRAASLNHCQRPRCESLGNQAMLRRLTSTAPHIQFKLTVGAVNDPLEAEADRAAEQVMRMSGPGISSMPSVSSSDGPLALHRKCAACEDEDKVHPRNNGLAPSAGAAPPSVQQVLNTTGQPLDGATRSFFEPRFGADFSAVRIHADQTAAQSAQSINARAYAAGSHIVLGPGTAAGPTNLLAHELAHVVQQQGAGRAEDSIHRAPAKSPKLSMPGFPCNRDGQLTMCNFVKDTANGPAFEKCFKQSQHIVDNCKGDTDECLAKAKCAQCDCVGNDTCKCTGLI
jgi:hypothetical protein